MIFHAPFVLAAFIVLVIALNTCQSTEWQSALQRCEGEIRLVGGADMHSCSILCRIPD